MISDRAPRWKCFKSGTSKDFMTTTKYQGFPTYRYAQIALKGSNKKGEVIEEPAEQYHSEGPNTEGREDREDREASGSMSPNDSVVGDVLLQAPSHGGELEVDYESDVTALYNAISNSQWNAALEALMANPREARTWVVRYKEDDTKGVMWRFLPIHSACARQPPQSVIRSLLEAYPEGAANCDDQGMVSVCCSFFFSFLCHTKTITQLTFTIV